MHIYPYVQDFELIYVNLFQIYSSDLSSTIWGHLDFRLPPVYAAFVNGVAVRDALLFALKSYKLMPFLLYREQYVPKIVAYSEVCYKTFLDYSPNVLQPCSSESELKVEYMYDQINSISYI